MKITRSWILGALTLGLSATATAAPAKTKAKAPAEASQGLSVGQQAPWFAGWTLDQRLINRTKLLRDKDAKGHLIVFFATWCGPCKKKLAHLGTAKEALSAAGVRLVLVDYAEPPEQVGPFLQTFKGLQPDTVIVDQFGRMSASFGVTAKVGGKETARLPLAVLLDAEGRVKAVYDEAQAPAAMLESAFASLGAP